MSKSDSNARWSVTGRESTDEKHAADTRHGKIEGSGSKETRPSDDAEGYNVAH